MIIPQEVGALGRVVLASLGPGVRKLWERGGEKFVHKVQTGSTSATGLWKRSRPYGASVRWRRATPTEPARPASHRGVTQTLPREQSRSSRPTAKGEPTTTVSLFVSRNSRATVSPATSWPPGKSNLRYPVQRFYHPPQSGPNGPILKEH